MASWRGRVRAGRDPRRRPAAAVDDQPGEGGPEGEPDRPRPSRTHRRSSPDELWARVEDVRRANTQGGGTRKAGRADLLDCLLTCTCGRRLRSDGTFADGRHRRLHPSPCKAWGPRARYGDEIWALQSGLPAQPWTGHSVSQWRFAVLGRTPTRATRQGTEPPAATNADLAGRWRPRERPPQIAGPHCGVAGTELTLLRVMRPRITAVTARSAPTWSGARASPNAMTGAIAFGCGRLAARGRDRGRGRRGGAGGHALAHRGTWANVGAHGPT